MVARILVGLWLLVYGRFRIRGAGLLIRLFYPVVPGLHHHPLQVPGVGTVYLNFASETAYSMLLRFRLNDLESDEGLYREMERYLTPGKVLWDVGAFVGYVTAHFAHPRFKLASIEAFEPNPSSLKMLAQIYDKHPVVKVHPYALGSQDEIKTLHVPTGRTATASLLNEPEATPVQVQVRNGDNVARQEMIKPPDVIKIDVEGFEPEVLKGLKSTIAERRPVIFFEHVFLKANQIQDLIPTGYQLYYIQDDGHVTAEASGRDKGHDAMLVPGERQDN